MIDFREPQIPDHFIHDGKRILLTIGDRVDNLANHRSKRLLQAVFTNRSSGKVISRCCGSFPLSTAAEF
jgi:hypothetical protein